MNRSTPVVVERLIVPELPPSLSAPCKAMSEYKSGELAEILETHGINMEAANRCISRHEAVINALQALKPTEGT